MKNQLLKLTSKPNLISLVILGFFVLLAWGSIEIYDTTYKGDGIYEESYTDSYGMITRTGKRDIQGRWQGKVIHEYTAAGSEDNFTEEVNYVDGIRQGLTTQTYGNGTKKHYYYSNGRSTDIPVKISISGFEMLKQNYPFQVFAFNGLGFDEAFVHSYVDTIEYIMGTYAFDYTTFDEYFDDATDALGGSRFDTINMIGSDLASWDGIYPYKNDEFRLAVVDYYLIGDKDLFDIVADKYPEYLKFMNTQTVTNVDFLNFCSQFEDSLSHFADLTGTEPLFADSVDERIFSIIYSFNFPTKSTYSAESLKKVNFADQTAGEMRELLKQSAVPKASSFAVTPEDIGSIILNHMIKVYDAENYVRNAARLAYMKNNGIIGLPYVSTVLLEHNSATSVTLQGFIVDDGGETITSSGIAWGTTFNPTIEDNTEPSEAQIGAFEETIDNLTSGSTYFARAYATNGGGTSYGNCITFIAHASSSVADQDKSSGLIIYPNPSKGFSNLKFTVSTSGPVDVNIFDMNGRIVFTQSLGIRASGENSVPLDVTRLKNGVYTCQVLVNTCRQTARLTIQR